MSHHSTRTRPVKAARTRRGICRFPWLAGAAAAAGLYCTVALAQQAAPARPAPQPTAASSSSSGGTQVGQLQQVVVTATFRPENLQSTPLSITAFTTSDLQQQHLTNVNDLGNVVPNAYFRQPVSNFGPTETIGLRGFTQTDFDFSFQPTVGVYVDDVYQGSLTGSSFDLADVQRVEVANGPQGTLFGMNSIGGAIRIITNKPQNNDSASIQVTYGEKHRVDVVGIGNAILVPDKLFARVVATSRTQGSIGHTLDFTCEMKAQGQPVSVYGTLPESVNPLQDTGCALGGLGGYQHQGVRAELRYLPTTKLQVNLNAYYYRQHDEPPVQALLTPYGGPLDLTNDCYSQGCVLHLGPTFTLTLPGVVEPKFGMSYTGNPHFVSPNPWDNYATDGDAVTGQMNNRTQSLNEWGISATFDYDVLGNLHAKYIFAYRRYTANWSADSDLTPFALTQIAYLQGHQQISNELRLTGNSFDHHLDYTLGAFFYDAPERENSASQFDAFAYLGILPNFENLQSFSTKNQSGYVHLVYHFTHQWSLSAGWRFTHQYQSETFDHLTGVSATSIILPGPVVHSGSRGLWSASINYQMTPSIFLYAESANGFTLQGFNARVETIGQAEETVPGQYAVNYEIGAKTDWFNHRLRVNGTLFYEDYKSYLNLELATQCTPAADLNPGNPIFGLGPGSPCPAGTPLAGRPGAFPWFYYAGIPAYMPGASLEVYAEPIDRLLLSFTGGWEEFHTKIRNPANPGYINPSVRLQPEWDASGGVQYGFSLPNSATLTPRLDWRYQGYQTNGPQNVYQIRQWRVPGYSLFNASLVYRPSSDRWNVAFRVENLFNKFYWEQLGAPLTQINPALPPTASNLLPAVAQVGTPGAPREWMVTFGLNF